MSDSISVRQGAVFLFSITRLQRKRCSFVYLFEASKERDRLRMRLNRLSDFIIILRLNPVPARYSSFTHRSAYFFRYFSR